MALKIDTTDKRCDFVFRKGEHFTRTITPYSDITGQGFTTITAARLGIFNGTLANPTSVYSGFSTTCTVSGGATIDFTWTATNTRTFTVGNDYCYSLEMELSDGTIETILEGMIVAKPEMAS